MFPQIWVRALHTKGGQAQTKSAQESTRKETKTTLTLPCQGIERRAFIFNFQCSTTVLTAFKIITTGQHLKKTNTAFRQNGHQNKGFVSLHFHPFA